MVKYSFEQVNIFFCTIVVALNGQPDFFMKITLTELEFAEKKIDNIHICFRIFCKINDYANRSNICAMFKKIIIKVYSLPYKVVFQIIILGNFPVLTRCDPCSFFEYLHKAYLISVSAEVGYFLNGHIGGRKIILSCLDLCG